MKVLKIPGFFSDFCSIFHVFPGFFCLNCQIPGFSRIPGKVATLKIKLKKKRSIFNSKIYLINKNHTANNKNKKTTVIKLSATFLIIFINFKE